MVGRAEREGWPHVLGGGERQPARARVNDAEARPCRRMIKNTIGVHQCVRIGDGVRAQGSSRSVGGQRKRVTWVVARAVEKEGGGMTGERRTLKITAKEKEGEENTSGCVTAVPYWCGQPANQQPCIAGGARRGHWRRQQVCAIGLAEGQAQVGAGIARSGVVRLPRSRTLPAELLKLESHEADCIATGRLSGR